MAYSDYGTVIKKNDMVISEDSWTEQELKINDNLIINFAKMSFWINEGRYSRINMSDILELGRYVLEIEYKQILFKVKKIKHHDQQFLLTFNYGKDNYKILFGYGVGCDWVDKKTRKYFNRFVNGELSERSAIEWNRIMLDYIEDNNVGK